VEVLEAIKQISNLKRLELIELVSRLMREELTNMTELKTQDSLSLAKAAEMMVSFYQQGNELTEFTDSQDEDFYEYEDYANDQGASLAPLRRTQIR
jgi:competence protein ComGF